MIPAIPNYCGNDNIFQIKTFLMLCSATERGLVERILENPNDALSREAYVDFLLEHSRNLEAKAEQQRVKEIRNPQPIRTMYTASGSIGQPPSILSGFIPYNLSRGE